MILWFKQKFGNEKEKKKKKYTEIYVIFFSLGHCPEKYGTTRNTAVKGTRLFLSLSFKFKLRTAEAPSLILRKKKKVSL